MKNSYELNNELIIFVKEENTLEPSIQGLLLTS